MAKKKKVSKQKPTVMSSCLILPINSLKDINIMKNK